MKAVAALVCLVVCFHLFGRLASAETNENNSKEDDKRNKHELNFFQHLGGFAQKVMKNVEKNLEKKALEQRALERKAREEEALGEKTVEKEMDSEEDETPAKPETKKAEPMRAEPKRVEREKRRKKNDFAGDNGLDLMQMAMSEIGKFKDGFLNGKKSAKDREAAVQETSRKENNKDNAKVAKTKQASSGGDDDLADQSEETKRQRRELGKRAIFKRLGDLAKSLLNTELRDMVIVMTGIHPQSDLKRDKLMSTLNRDTIFKLVEFIVGVITDILSSILGRQLMIKPTGVFDKLQPKPRERPMQWMLHGMID